MGSKSWFPGWSERTAHTERMQRAAGVSSVMLICHQDTWRALDAFWYGEFGDKPARVPKDRIRDRGNGLVEVTLSGPSLVISCWTTS